MIVVCVLVAVWVRVPIAGASTSSSGIQEFVPSTPSGDTYYDAEAPALDGQGNLWYGSSSNGSSAGLDKMTRSGSVVHYTLSNGAATTRGIGIGPDGNVWFTTDDAKIGKITPSGAITEFALPPDQSGSPYGIAAGPDGNLWFTLPGVGVGKVTTDGHVTVFPLPSASGAGAVANPGTILWGVDQGNFPSITSGPDGNLWVDSLYDIVRVTVAGTATVFPLPPSPTSTTPTGTRDIVAGPDGALWFAVRNENMIGRISTAGTFTFLGLPSGSVADHIVLGRDGALWFSEFPAPSVGRITVSGAVTEYPIPSGHYAEFIGVGGDGFVWVFENDTDFSPLVGRVLDSGGSSPAPGPAVKRAGDGIASVPDPGQLDLSVKAVATSFGYAGLLLLVLLFASEVLNSTLDANWAAIRRWPGIRSLDSRSHDATGSRTRFWSSPVGFVTYLAVACALVVAWQPSLQRVGDAFFGIVIGSAIHFVLSTRYGARHFAGQHQGRLHAPPASLMIAAAAIGASWLAGLASPITIGILAGAAFDPPLPDRRAGRLTAFVAAGSALVALAGWFLRWGLHSSVSHPSTTMRILESGLSVLLLAGIWGLALGMAPIRFMPGARVRAWNAWAWLALWLLGLALAVHILLSDYGVSNARGNNQLHLLVAEAVIALAAVLFWAYFAVLKTRRGKPLTGVSSASG